MKVYPSWRYHAAHAPKIIKSAKEDEKLGEEWADTPAAFYGKDVKEDDAITEDPAPGGGKRGRSKRGSA